MIVSNLKRKITGIATVALFSLFAISCNDEKTSGDNSSDTTTAGDTTMSNNPDNPAATNSTPGAKSTTDPAKRRTGRASATMAADDEKVKVEMDKAGVYTRAEVAPAYPGGQSGLDDYITSNIEYPSDAIDNNVEGTVYVQFAVDNNGKVSNVTTMGNKLGYGLEEEAVKVVSAMPAWTPGQVKGKKVKTWRTLPIVYKLES